MHRFIGILGVWKSSTTIAEQSSLSWSDSGSDSSLDLAFDPKSPESYSGNWEEVEVNAPNCVADFVDDEDFGDLDSDESSDFDVSYMIVCVHCLGSAK